MRTRLFTLCSLLIVAAGLLGSAGCNNDSVLDPTASDDGNNNGNNNNPTGGAADLDVVNSTPSSGDTNISGTGLTVQTSSDTLNSVPVTRVQLDATTGGNERKVLVYFETATGNPEAVSYSWGANVNDNIVYCPAAGCTGVSVNMATKEISFSNAALDNNDPLGGAPTKFATLSLGIIQYP